MLVDVSGVWCDCWSCNAGIGTDRGLKTHRACRESTVMWPTAASVKMTNFAWYFVRWNVHGLLNAERPISVWDYVEFSKDKSRMLNAIRIIKMWIERLSAGYMLLFEELYAEVEQIWFGIRLLKNGEHDGDDFTCEYNNKQQYLIAIGLLFCIFATKYVNWNEGHSTRHYKESERPCWTTHCEDDFLCDNSKENCC